MKPITTTLNEIRKHQPCSEGWEQLLKHLGKTTADDKPLELVEILKSNGIQDAAWCLRVLLDENKYLIRLFAAACAESVLHLYEDKHPEDKRVRDCINVARSYALGDYDSAARSAACSAAYSEADSQAYSTEDSFSDSAAF